MKETFTKYYKFIIAGAAALIAIIAILVFINYRAQNKIATEEPEEVVVEQEDNGLNDAWSNFNVGSVHFSLNTDEALSKAEKFEIEDTTMLTFADGYSIAITAAQSEDYAAKMDLITNSGKYNVDSNGNVYYTIQPIDKDMLLIAYPDNATEIIALTYVGAEDVINRITFNK